MSAIILKLREALAMCPICMDEFDDSSNIPRSMPCCGQPICQICLTKHIRKRRKFACPLCGVDINLPGGAESLPKDLTVVRFLDVMKISRYALPSCNDYTDNNKAMATCDECGVYLTCFKAHSKNRSTRSHKTSTFKDITFRLSTRLQCANRGGASMVDPSEMKKKPDKVSLRMTSLSGIEENIQKSQKKAIVLINKRFDGMLEELQHRRRLLLSQVEAKANKELKLIIRAFESHKTLQDKLKNFSTCGHSAASLLQETPADVEAERIAITFTEANMEQLLSTIQSAGQVRLVTFSQTQRPSYVPEDQLYRAIKFVRDDFPEVTQADVKLTLGGKDIIGPHLEFDHNTASANVQISSGVVSNIRPDPAPQDTGSRLKSERRALTLRPLPLKRGQVVVFSTRLVFTVKQLTETCKRIWETAVSGAPVDANWTQPKGLSVQVTTCSTHKQKLCLMVVYNDKLLTDVPLTKNQVGSSCDINLCIVIDRDAKRIHVVDVTDVEVVTTTEASLDRPLWVIICVAPPSYTEMKSELISGRELKLTPEIKQLLSSLI